jgi:hypothetical protein
MFPMHGFRPHFSIVTPPVTHPLKSGIMFRARIALFPQEPPEK